MLAIIIFFLSLNRSSFADEIKKLRLPDSPQELPWVLEKKHSRGLIPNARCAFGNIDGDKMVESFVWLYFFAPDGKHIASSMVVHPDPFADAEDWSQEYRGKYNFNRIHAVQFLDILNGPEDEVILTKILSDTVLLEIISFDSLCYSKDTVYLKVATARSPKDFTAYERVHSICLAAIDINSDGRKELIYNALAKPDYSIERGISAFDIKTGERLWFYPTADMVQRDDFLIIEDAANSPIFIFATTANMNNYEANLMRSTESYLVALDLHGRELWRETLCKGESSWPSICKLDHDNDGKLEICVAVNPDLTDEKAAMTIRLYEAAPYKKIIAEVPCNGNRVRIWPVTKKGLSFPDELLVFEHISGDNTGFFRLNNELKVVNYYRSDLDPSIALMGDLNNDDVEELIFLSEKKIIVLNSWLQPMAFDSFDFGEIMLTKDPNGFNCLAYTSDSRYAFYYLRKQNLLTMIYARYKWWLMTLTALLGAMLIAKVGKRLPLYKKLIAVYYKSAGVPGLDMVPAMVVILDRKKRVLYANKNSLTKLLFGESGYYKKRYELSRLRRYPEIIKFLDKTYLEPEVTQEGQYEIEGANGKTVAHLLTYPRVDEYNTFQGKILIGNDLTGKANFQRKAILGEAAQQWIHRFKNNMANIDLFVRRIRTDPEINKHLDDLSELNECLNSIENLSEKSKKTAEKIINFARITKPKKVEVDINHLISLALQGHLSAFSKNVELQKNLDTNLPIIKVDIEQMTEVFDNLISNAIDAITNKGFIIISTRMAKNLQADNGRRMISIVIEDSGCGIAEDEISKIFIAGYSGKRRGTGLGLAIVKEIVENHGGEVIAKSPGPGKGSSFEILLPIEE